MWDDAIVKFVVVVVVVVVVVAKIDSRNISFET